MKKTVMIVGGTLFMMATYAQTKPTPKPSAAKKPVPTVKKTTPAASGGLANSLDSVSYAIGILDGSFFKQQGITTLNYLALQAGFKASLENKNPLMTTEMADAILRHRLQEAAIKKIQPNIDEGNKFLAENKKRPEIVVTPSGLQYEVIKMGTGKMPVDTNSVKVHYTGTFATGKKFESSRDQNQPATFRLTQVIAGWTEGLKLMPQGSIFKFYIPYNLAYGAQGSSRIPGGSMLIFEIELLEILN